MMIEGWTGKGEGIHVRFGSEYHHSLEFYDKARSLGADHEEALKATVEDLLIRTIDYDNIEAEKKSEKLKSRRALVRTVVWYLEKFKDDPAKTLQMENGLPAVELSFKFELDWGPNAQSQGPYLLCGHLDRVVEFVENIFVMDRKTTTTTPGPYYFDQYEPDNQMTLYTLASQVIFEAPIKGVIIDVAQVLTDSSRFVRGFTYRTGDQLDEWIKDLEFWFNLAELYAEQGYWPQNDTACDKYGGCRFRGICSKSPNVRDNFLNSDFEKGDRWNPLRTR